jgi:hypothetical protein
MAAPKIIEFASPIPGTFPLHYDYSYWCEGLRAPFILKAQLHALAVGCSKYIRALAFDCRALLAMLLGLALMWRVPKRRSGRRLGVDVLLFWGLLWLVLYAAVHVETRLAAPAFLLIALSIVHKLVPDTPRRACEGLAAAMAGFILVQTLGFGWSFVLQAKDHVSPEYLDLARRLRSNGLPPGAQIAVVGEQDAFEAEFAHAARIKVVAEIIPADSGSAITDQNVSAVRSALAQAGIRAVVRTRGPLGAESLWRRVPLADGSVAGILFTRP